jgi:hypothetical protein
MLQLAHIAGPGLLQQPGLGRRRQAQVARAQAVLVLLQEAAGQGQHVAAALAQGRHPQRIDRQPVVEIGPEAAGRHLGRQVAVGGGQHPHVHPQQAVAAGALHLAALQHPQQLGLHRQAQLAHLVQEQGAAIGQLEPARSCKAPVKAPRRWPNSSLSARVSGRAAQLTCTSGRSRRADCVQALGHQLLAHARLAQDQHGQVRAGHQVDLAQQGLHGRAVAAQAALGQGAALQGLQTGLLAVGLLGQLADGAGRLDAVLHQRHQGLALGRAHRVEGAGLQGIQRQQAPQPPPHRSGAPMQSCTGRMSGCPSTRPS